MSKLPNDISRCSPKNCSGKNECLRYTDILTSNWCPYVDFSEFRNDKCEFKISK
jgi:hypothetical protein